MEEQVILVDENDEITGSASKKNAQLFDYIFLYICLFSYSKLSEKLCMDAHLKANVDKGGMLHCIVSLNTGNHA